MCHFISSLISVYSDPRKALATIAVDSRHVGTHETTTATTVSAKLAATQSPNARVHSPPWMVATVVTTTSVIMVETRHT